MNKITTLIAAVCFLFLFLGLMPVHGESEIYDSVLRLHVLANSDTKEDQELKLKVRDAVLNEANEIFADCKTREDAVSALYESIDRLECTAKETVESEGYSYDVSIKFGEEVYPTKSYESVAFPSGNYLSLQILIGDAEGQNWWCVLFPPMCLSAATRTDPEESFISVGLNKDQYGIITETEKPTYNIRFRILEVIEEALR